MSTASRSEETITGIETHSAHPAQSIFKELKDSLDQAAKSYVRQALEQARSPISEDVQSKLTEAVATDLKRIMGDPAPEMQKDYIMNKLNEASDSAQYTWTFSKTRVGHDLNFGFHTYITAYLKDQSEQRITNFTSNLYFNSRGNKIQSKGQRKADDQDDEEEDHWSTDP